MSIVIGITGGIATGKSTVTNDLLEKGYVVLDSDVLSKEALTVDRESIQKVKDAFDCVVDGEIDRKKLGNIVFHDATAKKQLESIVHPYVIAKLQEGIQKNKDREIVFLDIPLLYECHLEFLCDTIVVVYCDEKTQLSRLVQRNQIAESYAKTMIANQIPILEKCQKADIILDNTTTKEALLEQIKTRW